jgi:hypothetical protein
VISEFSLALPCPRDRTPRLAGLRKIDSPHSLKYDQVI